jgi:hypothetical protein
MEVSSAGGQETLSETTLRWGAGGGYTAERVNASRLEIIMVYAKVA